VSLSTTTGKQVSAESAASLTRRVKGEFLEMPGLHLQARQAARLWALEPGESAAILDRLVEDGFLWKRRDGSYLRASRI
jgi:DNA-binding MarR family transcriptional regulator